VSDKNYDVYQGEEKYITYHSLDSNYTVARASRRSSRGTVLQSTVFAAPRYPVYKGKRVLTVRVCGRSERGALGVNQVDARVLEVN
jgi:hypothetical protein